MTGSNTYPQYRKIKIFPNNEQKEFFDFSIRASRYVYNWALEIENNQYKKFINGESSEQFVHEKDLRKLYNEFILLPENEWLKDFQIEPARYIFGRIDYSFKMFFAGYNSHPKFKSKKDDYRKNKQSYRLRHDRVYFEGNKVRIPGFNRNVLIDCKFDTNMHLSDNIKFHQVDLIKDNLGNYYIGFFILEEKLFDYFTENNITKLGRAIGIDLNGRNNRRFVCSDGDIYEGRNLKSLEKHISNMNCKISKDINRFREMERTNPNTQPSKRMIKRRIKFRKANHKIHNIQENEIHLFTKKVINKNPDCVVMEDLKVREIRKGNKFINKALFHIELSRYKEIMKYKCNKYNIPFILADHNYPSSQLCSRCGNKKKISNSTLNYKCPICGLKIDRDLNAAINLEKLAYAG